MPAASRYRAETVIRYLNPLAVIRSALNTSNNRSKVPDFRIYKNRPAVMVAFAIVNNAT